MQCLQLPQWLGFKKSRPQHLVITPGRVAARNVADRISHHVPFRRTSQNQDTFKFQEQQQGRGFHTWVYIGFEA
jgi:hypothetical protein